MDNDTRDYLDKHFDTIFERLDTQKDALNKVHLQLAGKITEHDTRISHHEKEIETAKQRGWQLVAAGAAGAVSLAWQAITTIFGVRH